MMISQICSITCKYITLLIHLPNPHNTKKKLDTKKCPRFSFPSPLPLSPRLGWSNTHRHESSMQFRRENLGGGKCGDPGMYNHGKNGWHDDNRRGVDIPCGNQAHYRGTGRVYGLVNQIGGEGGIQRLLFCGYTHLFFHLSPATFLKS